MTRYKTLALFASTLLLLSCSDDHYAQMRAGNNPALRECPDFSSDPVSNYSNDDFSNLGCATISNNYVQLKDKRDYVRGTGNVKIDDVRDSTVLQNYMNNTSGGAAASVSSSASLGR